MTVSYQMGLRRSTGNSIGKEGRQVLYYVDPMHPAYTAQQPGIAPDCGMQLTPVFAGDARDTRSPAIAQMVAGAVSIDASQQQLAGIRLAVVEGAGVSGDINVVGRVVPEDTRVYRVNPGVDGFIRETYKDSVGVLIQKDQKLASYFSPDFLPAASGFLAAIERVPGSFANDGARTVPFPGALAKQGVSSIQGYTDRLRNLGMSDAQIKRMADGRQLPESIDVVAPADGFILARNITPGQHFERNMEFYRIADLSRVWVVAEVDEKAAASLRPGAPALIALKREGRRLTARIADSLPQSDTGGGTVKVRLEVGNPAYVLRPDMLVDVSLQVRLAPAITVPVDAVVDSGSRSRVYVEHGAGIFEPRLVETGWRSGERVEIRQGLRPGERVVVDGTFFVDSESRLRTPASSPAPAEVAPPAQLTRVQPKAAWPAGSRHGAGDD